ncbi:MAG TPA: hypothetical protein VFA19_03465 [Gaiellaceae bacterium]|nr:hypothetical protein [Gaiellaceae bacterium]
MDAAVTQAEETQTGARRALGTMLVERGLIDQAQLDEALRVGSESGERLGEVVVRLGWVSEEDLAKVLAEQWQLRYLDRSGISFDANALSKISREEATRLEALPMRFDPDGAMMVALAEPTEARLLALRSLLGDRLVPVVVPKSALDVGLRGDLLSRRGNGGAEEPADEAEAEPVEAPSAPEDEPADLEPAAVADGPVAGSSFEIADFDDAANTMIDDLRGRVATLREVVVAARSTQETDRAEIARLRGELGDRERELDERTRELGDRERELEERTRALRELQETLRGLADGLEASA